MNNRFPHLTNNESDFPLVRNVDVYKYDNDFDYARYDYTQMELMICTVPWDMGEAHIGNRTISGVGNVVYFETKERRDAWFDAIPDDKCYRFETKFKELHREHVIDVPVPYDMCAKHNYLVVKYEIFANENSPVQYEGDDGLREWFWFIREVEFVAPNTTRLHLLEDAWQTWIYDVDVTGMILERGHAPMFSTRAGKFLENPLDNNTYLLTEDVNYGEAGQVKHIDVLELNSGNMYACIATTANPTGTWGTKANNDWKVPASAHYENGGVPSVRVFAVAVANLNTFLSNITSSYPQFKQTVKGVFFASDDLLTLGTSFTFASITCYNVSAGRKTLELTKLSKQLFGYPSAYADIAKLYTSPYAHIEITDENGNVDIVKVEDSTGTLDASVALSLAYPFINIEAHLIGMGGAATATVTYKNMSSHTFGIGGQWYETLRTWKVPVFAVVLDPATEYDYATHYDRAQRKVDYDTAYANATGSASTTKSNADAIADANKANVDTIAAANKSNADDSADTEKANSDRLSKATLDNENASADTIVANAGVVTTGNSAATTRSNSSADTDANIATAYNNQQEYQGNLLITADTVATTAANERQAAISAMATMGSALVDTIASDLGGNFISGAASAAKGLIGGYSTTFNANVAVGLAQSQRDVAQGNNTMNRNLSNTRTTDSTTNLKDTNTDLTNIKNDVVDGTAANSSATQKANAKRLYEPTTSANPGAITQNAADMQATQKGNAARSKTATTTAAANTQTTEKANNTATYNQALTNANADKTRAQSNVTNDIAQAGIRAPFVFGQFADGDSAATKPIALLSHIVTQNKGAIAAAGDEMLRYGYMLDMQWPFDGNWNVGKYFTYWKLRDFWVYNLNVPDMYMDRLRFFLYGGVTIWRDPADIGKRGIYDNF